ncbi:MAG: type IV secretion system DNA-binding domain-containing protein [bacterium]
MSNYTDASSKSVLDHEQAHKNEITLFARTNFRNQLRSFGIKTEDRRRHMYIMGKSGVGKTTLLENLIYQDIINNHGLAVVDPHGDLPEKIIGFVPESRTNDVIYINPADMENPVGFNVMEYEKEEQKYLIASGLMGVFKKIWPDVWSARMEHILNNCILALLDYPESTLLGVNRILTDRDFRKSVVNAVKDPVVRSFWLHEFERWEPKYQKEAIAPIQNKVGQFLSSTLIRNIVAQTKSTFDIRKAMDTGKIIVINLSKGRIGEDASKLLGGMIITKIQLAAMERVDTPEEERQDFYLYVDEFQNFATEAFANILSEARKYRLDLIIAHQYIEQIEEEIVAAVFGNVGTIVTFRMGAADAEFLEPEFTPDFVIEDLVNLPNHQVYCKLMIDGLTSKPFSASTLPPLGRPSQENLDRVIAASRKNYAKPRAEIEAQINAWSDSFSVAPAEGGYGSLSKESIERKMEEGAELSTKELIKIAPKISETEVVVHAPEEEEKGFSLSELMGGKLEAASSLAPKPAFEPVKASAPKGRADVVLPSFGAAAQTKPATPAPKPATPLAEKPIELPVGPKEENTVSLSSLTKKPELIGRSESRPHGGGGGGGRGRRPHRGGLGGRPNFSNRKPGSNRPAPRP